MTSTPLYSKRAKPAKGIGRSVCVCAIREMGREQEEEERIRRKREGMFYRLEGV